MILRNVSISVQNSNSQAQDSVSICNENNK